MGEKINLAALAAKHGIQEIVLPGWDEEPFVCKAKRPSVFNMAAMGLIPNPLMDAVQAMFSGNRERVDAVPLDQQGKVAIQIARYALVEPTYAELEAAGIALTDEQLTNIYVFALGGARVLEPFRALLRGGVSGDGENVSNATEQVGGDQG